VSPTAAGDAAAGSAADVAPPHMRAPTTRPTSPTDERARVKGKLVVI
jgi:hypothetical protein